jgi:hypothetical protein
LLAEVLATFAPDDLAALAARFGLASALSEFVTDQPPDRQIRGMTRLVVAGMTAKARSSAQIDLLGRLASCPEIRETAPIVIKGAGLVLAGLTTPGERSFVDADVLVPASALAAWEKAALRSGATFKAGTGGYEQGYVSDRNALIELHIALPGAAGSELGPSYDMVAVSSRAAHGEFGSFGFRVPDPTSFREIAVHHFIHHHGGDPLHALRTLQDLACLQNAGTCSGLDWKRDALSSEVLWLARIARELGAGAGTAGSADEAARFLRQLADVGEFGETSFLSFAGEVDRWLSVAPERGGGKPGLILRRLFPPREQLGAPPGESAWRTTLRYAARPWTLARRYARSALSDLGSSHRKRRVEAWRSYLVGEPR